MPLTSTDRLHPKLLTDNVASLIRSAILAADLLAGEAISESALAAQLDVSRNTVREALQMLVGERLVHHRPHHGFSVTRLGQEDIRDICRHRRVLELGALEGLGNRVSDAVPAAQAALTAMGRATEERDLRGLFETDLAFHLSVIEVAASERLARAFRGVLSELQIAIATFDRLTTAGRDLVASHKAILMAMGAGDEARLRECLVHHLAESEARLLASVG